MSDRKNIFRIARRDSHDNEDQLTELLAYLLQEEPRLATAFLSDLGYEEARSCEVTTQRRVERGRLDLFLEAPPTASVVVESKLRATTTVGQCEKYIEHLSSMSCQARALVLLTKLHEPWPPGIPELAAKRKIQLVTRRWWDITSLLRQMSSELASDFAEMLDREGLVVPGSLTDADWIASGGVPPAATALMMELKPMLAKLSNSPTRRAIYDGRGDHYRSVYCSVRFKQVEIALGLAANWKDLVDHRRVEPTSIRPPIEGSVIASFVRDLTLTKAELLAPAEEAVNVGGTDVVGISWKQCPIRAASAASVLTAPDFLGQVEQALEYARATTEHFRRVGYLKDTP